MSVDNNTPRLQLPEWSATDGILRTDFNQAFALIDQWVAIAEHGTAAASSLDATDDARTDSFYYQTTTGTLSYSDGVSWHTVLTQDSVGSGLAIAGNTVSVNAGDGLGFTGSALKVNTGATTDISSDALIVKSGSLTQTQLSSGYRTIRVGTSAPASAGVATGDVWTDTATANQESLYVRTSGNTWARPWNMPWGIVALKTMPSATVSNIARGADTDVAWGSETMQVTANLVASRVYKITALVPEVTCSIADSVVQLRLLGNGTSYGRTLHHAAIAAHGFSSEISLVISGLAAQSWTWKANITLLTVTNDNGYSVLSIGSTGGVSRSYISIEDLGPVV